LILAGLRLALSLQFLLADRRHFATEEEAAMTLERWIRLIAGSFVTISVVLSYVHSPYWLFFTLFVGLNLFQSALTRWCLMEEFVKKLGVRSEAAGSRA